MTGRAEVAAVLRRRKYPSDYATWPRRKANMKTKVKGKRRVGRPPGVGAPGESVGALLGRAVRARREAAGLTLDELSDRTLGIVTSSGICKCEQGHEPRLRNLLAICFALGTTPDSLLGFKISELSKDELLAMTA